MASRTFMRLLLSRLFLLPVTPIEGSDACGHRPSAGDADSARSPSEHRCRDERGHSARDGSEERGDHTSTKPGPTQHPPHERCTYLIEAAESMPREISNGVHGRVNVRGGGQRHSCCGDKNVD